MNNQKQILYIGGFELPDKNAAAQRVIANGKAFRDLGYSVYYLSSDRAVSKITKLEDTKDIFEGFTYYRLKYPVNTIDWFLYMLSINDVKSIMDLLNNLKFIVAYNYPAIALLRLKYICEKNNIALISDCTEWYVPQGNILFKIVKGADTFLRMRVVQRKLDGVIAISKYLYDYYAPRMKNVIQLPPMVDLASVKWAANVLKDEDDAIKLVYAGSPGVGAKDRIDIIISTLSTIRVSIKNKLLLNVIGLTKEQYLNSFNKQPPINDIDKFVSFKGRLSHEDALMQVKRADYAIFIRDNNLVNTAGFPTKFVEAFSCGIPILANASSNITDYLKNGETGYVLDTTNTRLFCNSLIIPLSLNKFQISTMKNNILKKRLFDYKNYLTPISSFLDSVSKDNHS
ncbi:MULTISPECIES: glycosyltransferase [unclassified Mucilaginibacter]|uniref:glycosyltransferase n=1 Tax=unclassified Mucilaginibacter TaxID=2617802 RepID=UPI002AC90F7B|nr:MULTISPECIES: glycosyltransferase [unclassified Mucilaginibacter]MEB0262952.1 glycosyltransferase [Mucilaginibacter sp. 10I4]MEB0277553.1 glycosyltransferase [Mucilaginibacter sp. 10B2]MEB0299468.1 glycosyltransferase [Mucilaginibacter sp. 5C4]WPX24818.1 glycosyltransferase [Mucilaginibacter sp. 5C4]